MNDRVATLPKFFYVTPPRPCPYIAGRIERDVFVELDGANADAVHSTLARYGFRRSHNVAYRPDCPGCRACVSVRVVVAEFTAPRSLRRVLQGNADVTASEQPVRATPEQFALFARYQQSRHTEGEMAAMAEADYRAMIENTSVSSRLVEFRGPDHRLIAACLADVLEDGLSAVYSFFDPDEARRSLGTHAILWLIGRAQQAGLPFLYLGYWIEQSRKMAYKRRFGPLQALGPDGWVPVGELPSRRRGHRQGRAR